MFSNFLVSNKQRIVRDIFSGKIPIENNPGVGNSYRTTHIFTPASHESDPTIKFVTKLVSGPPALVPAIPKTFTHFLTEQKGGGNDLEEVLQHPLKISEEEFDELSKDNNDSQISSQSENEAVKTSDLQTLG